MGLGSDRSAIEFTADCLADLGYSTRAHIVRAGLEAICFQTCDVLESMRKDANLNGLERLKVDGGAVSNNLLLQMQVS